MDDTDKKIAYGDFAIRPLNGKTCREFVVPVIRQVMGDELGRRAAHEFADCADDYQGEIWGGFVGKVPVGFCSLGSEISPRKVWLGYFAVLPEWRRRGYGDALLRFVEDKAFNGGYRWILVETYDNSRFTAAMRFYKQHGYSEIGTLPDYLDDDSDVIYFRKDLDKERE